MNNGSLCGDFEQTLGASLSAATSANSDLNFTGLPSQGNLQHEINRLKDQPSHESICKDSTMQQLLHAINILAALESHLISEASEVPWRKIRRAHKYLDHTLKAYLEQE
jgi:hypothetical protein